MLIVLLRLNREYDSLHQTLTSDAALLRTDACDDGRVRELELAVAVRRRSFPDDSEVDHVLTDCSLAHRAFDDGLCSRHHHACAIAYSDQVVGGRLAIESGSGHGQHGTLGTYIHNKVARLKA